MKEKQWWSNYLGNREHPAEQKSGENVVVIRIITQPHLDLNVSRIQIKKGRERKREKDGEIESGTLTKSYLEEALRVENLAEGKAGRCLSSMSSPLAGEPTTTSFSFSFFIDTHYKDRYQPFASKAINFFSYILLHFHNRIKILN